MFYTFVLQNINDMTFEELKTEIIKKAKNKNNFLTVSNQLQKIIFKLPKTDIIGIITEIGVIPENIGHDSTEEKLYTKVSEILFAKALKELNLEVRVLNQRADCADIVAQSHYHGYSLVGDAKAFRLSRTAKNAKDFKVNSMVHWKGDSDYSVLACPYYQYPKSNSQIYKDALNGNVSLFSWEYLYILLKEDIVETPDINLKDIWNQSAIIASHTAMTDSKTNFLAIQNKNIANLIHIEESKFNDYFDEIKKLLINRGYSEIQYYENEIERIKFLSRKKAINELLISLKLDSKINTIKTFIDQIHNDGTIC